MAKKEIDSMTTIWSYDRQAGEDIVVQITDHTIIVRKKIAKPRIKSADKAKELLEKHGKVSAVRSNSDRLLDFLRSLPIDKDNATVITTEQFGLGSASIRALVSSRLNSTGKYSFKIRTGVREGMLKITRNA